MARNEDGEFELMLGNKQLLSVFFLMVLLLCLCFVGGYLLGRSAAPVLTAVNETSSETSASPEVSAPPPVVESTPDPEPVREEPPPVRTAPQVSTEVAKTSPVKETPPPPTKTAPVTRVVAASQPVAGKIYLQVSATDKDKADVMVDLLRGKNLPGLAVPIPENPANYRVLVGPIAEAAIPDMRAQLKAGGFPGDQAFKRVF